VLKHALDSFDGGDGKLLCFEVARGEPVPIIQPVHTNAALVGDDDGSLGLLPAVEFDGGDACHKTRRARHAGYDTSGSLGFGDRLDLQPLDGPESGSDRLHFTSTGFLVAIDGFQFHGQIAQQVESIVELVTNEQSHVYGFFHWSFLTF